MNKYPGKSKMVSWLMALALTGVAAGCGDSDESTAVDPAGVPFATTNNSTSPGAVNLGTAASFVILAKSAVSTTGITSVVGHVGVSPAAESLLTGFSQARDATNQFSTSSLVTGRLYAADMAPPTPTQMTTAIGDMETAYTDAAGRPGGPVLGAAGDIGGLTITPGTYTFATSLFVNSDVTLSGSANDVWLFQIAGDLTQASGTRITLAGGALPKNIFWQTFGVAAIGTTAHFEGIILSQTAITVNTGATVNGRMLAQTAVTLNANAVTQPAP
jgi:Ice-binding-like